MIRPFHPRAHNAINPIKQLPLPFIIIRAPVSVPLFPCLIAGLMLEALRNPGFAMLLNSNFVFDVQPMPFKVEEETSFRTPGQRSRSRRRRGSAVHSPIVLRL